MRLRPRVLVKKDVEARRSRVALAMARQLNMYAHYADGVHERYILYHQRMSIRNRAGVAV